MNWHGIWSIYRFEMARGIRTLWQTLVAPVLTTALYFIVFGGAIGSRMQDIGGIDYGAFIVPGLIMLTVLTQSISNASFGIYFPKFSKTIFEILSAPVSPIEIVAGYVGAAATKSVVIGAIIYVTALFFVDIDLAHPAAMVAFLLLTSITFCLFGFIIGIWAQGFEQLSFIPILVVTPLTFLGGAFYTIDMLPDPWRTISLANPVVYLVSGFRWSFFGQGDVSIGLSLGLTFAILLGCLALITWMFKSGYRLKA